MTLVRPLGTILPVADATMSIVPHHDHARAMQKRPMSVKAIARPMGDGGVSTISRAAGKKASSSRRLARDRGSGTTWPAGLAGTASLMDFMDSCLQAMQRGIAATCFDQRVVRAIFDHATAFEGDDAIHHPHRRQTMGND